jgi:hypothetical protein
MLLSLVLAALVLSPDAPVSSQVIRNSPGLQSRPSIASDGTDFFAAWEHNTVFLANAGDVVGSRIRADGEVMDNNGGIPLQPIWVADMEPVVVWNGSTYAVAIEDGPLPWPYGVKVVEVDRDGTVHAEKWLVTPRDITSMDFAWNGTEYLLVWREEPGSVRARRYDRGFTPIGEEQILGSDGVEVAAASNGVGFLATWITTDHKAFASNLTTTTQIGASAVAIDAASNGTSYAVFANDVIVLDANVAMTSRTTMPAGIDSAITWSGTQWIAAWSANERVFTQSLDGGQPTRVSNEESLQRFPALASTANGTMVLWSDAPLGQPYRGDIRRAFLGNATNNALVSTGVTIQAPLALAWSPDTLGVLWNEGDGISATMRLGQLLPDGTVLSGEGEIYEPATRASLASNGSIFAIAAERDGNIEVDLPTSRRIALGAGILPRIASDGRDFLVVWFLASNWYATSYIAQARIVSADGVPGPLLTLPHLDEYTNQAPAGLVWCNGTYVALTVEQTGGNMSYALVSTPVSAAGEVGSPVAIARGSGFRVSVNASLATNGTDLMYAWTTFYDGVHAKLGIDGAEMLIAEHGALEDLSFFRGEPLYLISTSEGRVLQRGDERVMIGKEFPMRLAENAALIPRTIERIPGFPDLAIHRAAVRFLGEARRRGIRH